MKIKTYEHTFFEIFIIHKPSVKSHTNFGPDRFRRFDVYWIQTDRQAKYIIDNKRFTQLGCKEIGKRKF